MHSRESRALTPRERGFTLIEVLIVMAIIGVLAGMAIAGLSDLTKRTDFTDATGDLITGLRRTQQESTGRGAYTAFVIDTTLQKWWGIQTDASFTLASFDPANPGDVIVSGTFPKTVTFGPAAGYGTALPSPFNRVPVLTTDSPNIAYCSFCDTTSQRGSVLFEPGGGKVKFNGGPTGFLGQQLTVNWTFKKASQQMVIAIIERTGLIETFHK